MTPIELLVRRLNLAPKGENQWQGAASPGTTNKANALFGGMVFAQAIVAAERTFADRNVYYATQLFLRKGSATDPISFAVRPLHVGRSYASLQVEAVQKDELIGHLQVGVVRSNDAWSPNRSDPPPTVSPKESMVAREAAGGDVKAPENPVRFLVDPAEESSDEAASRYRVQVDPIPGIEEYATAIGGFASDRAMMTCGWKPHRHDFALRGATLNHSLWVHRRFDWNRAHTYVLTSPSFSSGRAIISGQFHDDRGVLIASTAQEATYVTEPNGPKEPDQNPGS